MADNLGEYSCIRLSGSHREALSIVLAAPDLNSQGVGSTSLGIR
jgi:hypothetical protein